MTTNQTAQVSEVEINEEMFAHSGEALRVLLLHPFNRFQFAAEIGVELGYLTTILYGVKSIPLRQAEAIVASLNGFGISKKPLTLADIAARPEIPERVSIKGTSIIAILERRKVAGEVAGTKGLRGLRKARYDGIANGLDTVVELLSDGVYNMAELKAAAEVQLAGKPTNTFAT